MAQVPLRLHKHYHAIFGCITGEEVILLIKYAWTNENGEFRYELFCEKQIESWVALFGEKSVKDTSIAIKTIEQKWTNKDKKLITDYFTKRRDWLTKTVKEIIKRHDHKRKLSPEEIEMISFQKSSA